MGNRLGVLGQVILHRILAQLLYFGTGTWLQTNIFLKPRETASTYQHFGPISEINISTCGQHLGRREIANIQHPHLGRSKTTSVEDLN